MELIAGYSHLNDGVENEHVEWHYDTCENVQVLIGSGEFKEIVLSIDPEDLLSVADAVRGKMKRDLEDKVDQMRIQKERRKP